MLLLPMMSAAGVFVQKDTLFIEDFGGNNPNDPTIATTHNPNIDNSYTMVTSEANLKCGYENNFTKTYLLTKVGKHSSGWHLQMDHTYPGDSTRGYFMLVDDGPVYGDPLYTSKGILVSPGQKLHFGASFANIKTFAGSAGNPSLTIPAFRVRLLDMVSGNVLREFQTGQIPYDSSQPNEGDYIYQAPWRYFEDVYLVPGNITEVQVEVAAETTNNRWGNDYAVDDIVAYAERELMVFDLQGCDSVAYNGEMFYADTVFTHTIDEIVYNVDITVHHSTYVHESYSGTDSMEYGGIMYYADTTLTIRETTKDGCDSILEVTLQIAHLPAYYQDSLIVNEMNWLVVCNNRLLREKYPAEYYVYQWIKDGQPVKSKYAYPDYYTEDERLEGVFELEVTLYNSGQPNRIVRSNVVTILPAPAGPKRIAIYDKTGGLIYEAEGSVEIPNLQSGFYVVRIEQDNKTDVQKLIVR